MQQWSKLSPILLSITLALMVSACAGSPRSNDAAPVPEQVLPATPPPAEPISTPVPATAGTPPAAPAESEAPAKPQPSEDTGAAIMTLNLSGGVVGFCDTLTVTEGGQYHLQSCQGEAITATLESPDLEAVQTWHNDLASFSLNFEDNPGGADNLISEFVFKGKGSEQADETLQQVIFDWANGLLIRSRPQAVEAPPTPPPPEIGPDGLCPDVSRPALLVGNFENPSGLILIDPNDQTSCDILLQQPPFGRILTAAGHIFYPVFDPEAQTITIWQLGPDGVQTALDFTSVTMEDFGPYSFVLSQDGTKIAWARTTIDHASDPPLYRNDLWVAGIDGSNQTILLDQVENNEWRYAEPVRFSQDNSLLFYALQPDGVGGMIFNFSGRYDNLYRLPLAGGQPQLLYDCGSDENVLCIGDISPDGAALAYSQPATGQVQLLGSDGNLINSLTPPATDYIGPAIFGPGGQLAFISATLSQGGEDELPKPTPGFIGLLEPPYTGQPGLLLSQDGVATIWEWLDENRLAFGHMNDNGDIGTAIVTREGQVTQLSPNFPLAVLR